VRKGRAVGTLCSGDALILRGIRTFNVAIDPADSPPVDLAGAVRRP
jgi:hypothetical protein